MIINDDNNYVKNIYKGKYLDQKIQQSLVL